MNGAEFTEDFKRLIRGMFKKVVLSAIGLRMLQVLLGTQLHWYTSATIALLCYPVSYTHLDVYKRQEPFCIDVNTENIGNHDSANDRNGGGDKLPDKLKPRFERKNIVKNAQYHNECRTAPQRQKL